ncbi:MAG: hypothetical protein Q8Q20_00505 [bacterium]|nr:hypothetical protein [bacterium]
MNKTIGITAVALIGIAIITFVFINYKGDSQIEGTEQEYIQGNVALGYFLPDGWEAQTTEYYEEGDQVGEREPFLSIRKRIDDDSGFFPYAYVWYQYFRNTGSFDNWYQEHREELIRQYGLPKDEKENSQGTVKSLVIDSEFIVDPMSNSTTTVTYQFTYFDAGASLLELRAEAPVGQFSGLQEEINAMVENSYLRNE